MNYAEIEAMLISEFDTKSIVYSSIIDAKDDDNKIVFDDENKLKEFMQLANHIYGIELVYKILSKFENSNDILLDIQNKYIDICDTLRSATTICKNIVELGYNALSWLILNIDVSLLGNYETLLKVHSINK